MAPYRTHAVVLRTYDLGEADKILLLYSKEEGKLSAVAKGARKPKSRSVGAAQVFQYYDYLLYRGRNLDVVQQYETIRSYRGIREDLDRLAYASYAAELVIETSHERDPSEEVFELLLWALDNIENERNLECVIHVFELQLMDAIGYRPEISTCASCGKELKGDCLLSPEAGGALCGSCAALAGGAAPLSEGALSTLRVLQSAQGLMWRSLKLQGQVAQEVSRALEDYISYRIEKRLPALQFLKSLRQTK